MNPYLFTLAGAGVVALAKKAFDSFFAETKIFVSYYYKDERSLKRLLKAWSNNDKFKLSFKDTSADVSLQTANDDELKKELTNRIKKSDLVLVLIGKKTHSRKWVSFEISEAVRLGKPLIVVKQKKQQRAPSELKSVGAKWVYAFKAERIHAAVQEVVKK